MVQNFVLSDTNKHSLDKLRIEEIFRELYPALVNYAVRFVGDVQTGKDLVQDTFVALWQNRNKTDIHTGVRSYLYKSVRNRALNYLRDVKSVDSLDQKDWRKENVIASGRLGSGSEADNGAEEEEKSAGSIEQKMKLVMMWIQELPDRQKEAFELSRFDGLTHSEIAGVMAISEKTVNNHLIAALKSIKQKQQDHFNNLN